MTMYSVKIHRGAGGEVLAVCDEDILGETFEEGQLRIRVGEGFYKGDIVEEAVLIEHLGRARSINIVGNCSVDIAIREGLVDADCVISIGGVKHAQVLR